MSQSALFGEHFYARKATPAPEHDESSLHTHKKYEVLYFETGHAELVFENKKVLLFPGALLLIPPSIHHRINILSPLPYKRAVINFAKLPDLVPSELFADARVLDISKSTQVLSVFERMREYDEAFSGEQRTALLSNLTVELLCLLQKNGTTIKDASNEYGLLMTDAVAYIDKHLTTINNVEELCDALHVSRAFLYREFQNAVGLSPMRYIHQKRLWAAHELLKSGESATKVCFNCGYREYSAFFRAYRSMFGYSPQDTRFKA